MKMTTRTAVGCGAVSFGAGMHLLAVGHPAIAAAIGGAAFVYVYADDVRRRRTPACPVELELDEAAPVAAPVSALAGWELTA